MSEKSSNPRYPRTKCHINACEGLVSSTFSCLLNLTKLCRFAKITPNIDLSFSLTISDLYRNKIDNVLRSILTADNRFECSFGTKRTSCGTISIIPGTISCAFIIFEVLTILSLLNSYK
uniref:Uncharacterized protein n=1 Tax=Glossina pallidipes TaxID=7398 RepID=A0A1B0A957_GLOPL